MQLPHSTYNGGIVEEHNGTAFAVDPDGYGPFSAANWLSQLHRPEPRPPVRLQLQMINATNPCTGTPGNCTASGAIINENPFPFVREVFNIVQYDEVQPSDTTTYNQAFASIMATTNSSLCDDGLTIFNYGYGLLPSTNPNLPDTCGSIANSLRGFDPSSNPV